ncbi:MAG TPA: tripartite tricarboxylate transporter substrate binding protein [Burkholderiales bacterium]|nr:tripartite tricarboxylate transporter substrate binding protein [Burkholderiales bacterium]
MRSMMAAALAAMLAGTTFAQGATVTKADPAPGYPDKPIRWIVPFTPGGSNDVIGRLIASKMAEAWGQQVVVDNRGGAGGLIGAETVARAAPDGYTLILSNPGPSVNAPLLAKNAPYRMEDFSPVIWIGYAPLILVTNLNFPPRNPKEFVVYAKANPNKVSWGSSGIGSSLHIGLALLQAATQIPLAHVPYKGTAPALTDVVGGQIQGMHTTTLSAEAQMKGNRIRIIGIASPKRVAVLPDVPTLAEFGIKDAEALVWFGMGAPAKTPRAVIDKLNREVNRILALPDVKARFDQLGLEVQGGTPEAMDAFMRNEATKIRRLISAGLLKPE